MVKYKVRREESDFHWFCNLLFTTQSRLLTNLGKKHFENIVGKGENGDNQHLVLFPQCFLPNQQHKSSLELHLKCRLQMLSNWTGLKFCRLLEG